MAGTLSTLGLSSRPPAWGSTGCQGGNQDLSSESSLPVMKFERVFLGWERPGLPSAVRFLRERYASGRDWDLRRVLVVVPGGRAARRLLELLAEEAPAREDRPALALAPPVIVTTGNLPEQLYPAPLRPVEPLRALLLRIQALQARPDLLARIVPAPPEARDLPGWVSLAQDLERLVVELAGEALTPADVARHCRTAETAYCDAERWEALEALQQDYLALLEAEELADLHAARFRALEAGAPAPFRDVVLLGTVDLNRISRRLLERSGARVTALVPASEEAAEGYDAFGCLKMDWWEARRIEIPESAIRIVDRPRNQLEAVVERLATLGANCRADQVTLGVGDAVFAPALERGLELAGIPARSAVGREVAHTRPVVLLRAIADYLEDRRTDRFAALLRHPDIEAWLLHIRVIGEGHATPLRGDWLKLLDEYTGEHLPVHLGDYWAEDVSQREGEPAAVHHRWPVLQTVYSAISRLLAPLSGRSRPLREWASPLAALLGEVYGGRDLDRNRPADLELIRSLETVALRLREFAELPPEAPGVPVTGASQALALVLNGLAEVTLPEEGKPGAVELLGWLELALDDAPVLLVTGFNEGCIPESVSADAFLPDGLRRELGLLDNRRRYARDAAILEGLVRSREQLLLVAGRRTAAGEPLAPSRLFFACDEATLIRRALTFYGAEAEAAGGAAGVPAPRLLLPAGEKSRFRVPRPRKPERPVNRLPVTAFRSYLACPYRFYLRHVLKLAGLDDARLEMDGGLFGNLLHDVVRDWGRGPLVDTTNPALLAEELGTCLDHLARERFGPERLPAVEIQLYQARRRLQSFARWQAAHAAEGWRIEWVEADLEATVEVDGEPFTLHGRVDRIDVHPDLGCLVLDYKTGDMGRGPEEVHRTGRKGARTWADLQLPLYRRLAASLDIEPQSVRLGYLCLPRDLGAPTLLEAEWTEAELAEAEAEALRVIREIRIGEFWPPKPAPLYTDDFSGICLDRCLDREALLQ